VILVLGGTAEARELAARLVADDVPVVSSLAGRVARPRLPAGEVRVGGFGGAAALAAWLGDNGVRAVVDATHPFALRIAESAAQACASAGLPLLRLERPGWTAQPGDRWTWVEDLTGAAHAIPALGRRVFLTTGRQGLDAFAHLSETWFLIRCVDPPAVALPARHALVLDRGPYTAAGEGVLFDRHAVDLLVTKDSGGDLTRAKLDSARARGVPVVVVRRPARPAARHVTTVNDALEWVRGHAGAG
jgi:precorrin-6A/cobalt-precorrin-6A reductase